jgi:hypothetical protein
MRTYTLADLLMAIDKSLDLILRHIECKRYEAAIERCNQTKTAIRKTRTLPPPYNDKEVIDKL